MRILKLLCWPHAAYVRVLVWALLFASPVLAQTPDCVSFYTFSTTPGANIITLVAGVGNTFTIDNRQTACINWTMVYESTGFSGVSLTFQSADGAITPGALGAFSGTTLIGANPATNTTRGLSTFTGYAGWFNVNLVAVGSGTLRGALYGYRNGFPPPAPIPPPPCPGTNATPCVVSDAQPANASAAWTSATPINTTLAIPVNNYANVMASYTKSGSVTGGVITFEVSPDNTTWFPIAVTALPGSPNTAPATTYTLTGASNAFYAFVGGFTGFRVRLSTLITGLGGTATIQAAQTVAAGPPSQFLAVDNGGVINDPLGAATTASDGRGNTVNIPFVSGSISTNWVYGFLFNGVGWDRQFYGSQQVQVTITSGTAQLMVPQVALKTTRLTHLDFAMNAATNVTIVQGTTVSTPCDTTPTTLAGPYENVAVLALDWSPLSPLKNLAANLDTCLLFSGTVTGGGVAMYAQF